MPVNRDGIGPIRFGPIDKHCYFLLVPMGITGLAMVVLSPDALSALMLAVLVAAVMGGVALVDKWTNRPDERELDEDFASSRPEMRHPHQRLPSGPQWHQSGPQRPQAGQRQQSGPQWPQSGPQQPAPQQPVPQRSQPQGAQPQAQPQPGPQARPQQPGPPRAPQGPAQRPQNPPQGHPQGPPARPSAQQAPRS